MTRCQAQQQISVGGHSSFPVIPVLVTGIQQRRVRDAEESLAKRASVKRHPQLSDHGITLPNVRDAVKDYFPKNFSHPVNRFVRLKFGYNLKRLIFLFARQKSTFQVVLESRSTFGICLSQLQPACKLGFEMDKAIMQSALFEAKLKLQRAQRHIDETRWHFTNYIESDFCRVFIDRETKPGEQLIRATAEPIPGHMLLSLGDAFHNLNAAMDYIMTGMMRAAGLSSKRVTFPTDETREQLRRSFLLPKFGMRTPRNRRIVEAFPSFVCFLLTCLKPYRGGPYLLWEITKSDNVDKHNLIIPTVVITELWGTRIEDIDRSFVFSDNIIALDPGSTLNIINLGITGTNLKILEKGRASASIRFSSTAPAFAGEPVFPRVTQCLSMAEEVVRLIEASDFSLFRRPDPS
jgi:hypothetical protein